MSYALLVVGVDPSLTGTGIAIGETRTTIGSARIGPKWLERRARYLGILARVTSAITGHPDYVAHRTVILIEGYAFASSSAGHHDIVELGLLLRWHLTPRCAALMEVSPSSVKMYATGKGNAKKPDLRVALLKRADIDEPDENRVDAAWLRLMGLDYYGQPGALELPQSHRRALDGVPWLGVKVPV